MAGVRDVAKRAGVSAITVSRTINSPEKVSEQTRKKVYLAMEELNYSMNPVAKGFSTNKTQVICVYIPKHIDNRNLYVMELISGISEACSENLYSFLIIRDFDINIHCDGYILTGVSDQEIKKILAKSLKLNREVVVFGTTKLKVDQIDVDNYYGAHEATKELLKLGHSKIDMLSIEEEKDSYFLQQRELGFKKAINDKDSTESSKIYYTNNNLKDSYKDAVEIIKTNAATAYFCATDIIGVGLIRALEENNLKVPSDVSVIGFDGFGYQFMSVPQITTVEQPIYDIGKELALMLINNITKNNERLVITRKSVKTKILKGGTL